MSKKPEPFSTDAWVGLSVFILAKFVATGGLYFLLRHEVRKLEKARKQA